MSSIKVLSTLLNFEEKNWDRPFSSSSQGSLSNLGLFQDFRKFWTDGLFLSITFFHSIAAIETSPIATVAMGKYFFLQQWKSKPLYACLGLRNQAWLLDMHIPSVLFFCIANSKTTHATKHYIHILILSYNNFDQKTSPPISQCIIKFCFNRSCMIRILSVSKLSLKNWLLSTVIKVR